MNYVCLHDKEEIEQYLNKNVFLHVYSIGDLDDFFWPYTIWYGNKSSGNIDAVVLIYVGMPLPTVLVLSEEQEKMTKLLTAIRHLLPARFYAHLSPGFENFLSVTHDFTFHGAHSKMALIHKSNVAHTACIDVKRLSIQDLAAIQELYRQSYPGNWFDMRMLETDKYFGIWEGLKLVSIAGVHVYSRRYKVAALGNITTLPSHRNKGYGKRVTAKLCQCLIDEGLRICLNVKSDNQSAISCYEKIGFKIVAPYSEFMFHHKGEKLNGYLDREQPQWTNGDINL